MRELPEIEVLRRELEREVVGKKVKAVEVQMASVTKRARSRKVFVEQLEGCKFEAVTRSGLLLLFRLDGEKTLVVRLGDTGSIRKGTALPAESTASASLTFTQGSGLRFNDFGADGELAVVATDDLEEAFPEIAAAGFDPLDEPMTWVRFSEMLSRRSVPLRTLLLDPGFVAGIGDVYADEILFEAGVRFDRSSTSLSTQEVRRLYRSLIEILHDAVKHHGSHIGEHGFVDLVGKAGDHQEHLQIWGREGELSPRSRTPIKKGKHDGRVTFYCDTQV